MKRTCFRLVLAASICAALAGPAGAGTEEIPLLNWPVPSAGGLHPLAELAGPLPFTPIAPCRVADTRDTAMPAGYGPPALSAGAIRSFTITGRCGIPGGTKAVSLNLTVVGPRGAGDIRVFPQDGPTPMVSTLNYAAGQTVANAAIAGLSPFGGLSVLADVSATDLIIDVNGYLTNQPSAGFSLWLQGRVSSSGLVDAQNFSGAAKSSGVHGYTGYTSNPRSATYGVLGTVDESTAPLSAGVRGEANRSDQLRTFGVIGDAEQGEVIGHNPAGPYGVGVMGRGLHGGVTGAAILPTAPDVPGVFRQGVWGSIYDTTSHLSAAWGALGYSNNDGSSLYGLLALGNLAASGTKMFLDPHPTDPAKVIRYVCLEGPEAGTYFRGRGRFVGRRAVILVPESFRLVTDEEGLTVQLTPIGEPVSTSVRRMSLDTIEVASTGDGEFSYLVQGVRRTFKGHEAIVSGDEFWPRSPEDRMSTALSEGQRRNLITAGIYNEDGTVNMRTAERLGLARAWREREDKK